MIRSNRRPGRLSLAIALAGGLIASSFAAAFAEPLKINIGIGGAAEEQLWLLIAKPELAPNQNKAYTIEFSRFPGGDKRLQAFEAGAIDIATATANQAIFAAGEGLGFKIIASLSREGERGFFTKFMVRPDSPIKTVADLKGKTIGINSFSGSGHLWTKLALERHGLSESDVTLVPIPLPSHGESLKAGKIDVGMFPQPFADMISSEGAYRTIFTSKDGVPFEEELMLLVAKEDFLRKNSEAMRALLSDLARVTAYYAQNPKLARQALMDGKMVRADPAIYLNMADYFREPDLRVDVGALEKMQDLQLRAGFQKQKADIATRVDTTLLPK